MGLKYRGEIDGLRAVAVDARAGGQDAAVRTDRGDVAQHAGAVAQGHHAEPLAGGQVDRHQLGGVGDRKSVV